MPTPARSSFHRLLPVSLAVAALLPAQEPPSVPRKVDRLLVCNKADHSLSIFDPATRTELAVLQTGDGPHEVAVSPDGRIAVVADYGAQKPGTTLTVIDLVRSEVQRTIELTRTETAADGTETKKALPRPHGLQFVDATTIVFTSESSRRLARLDLPSDRVTKTWSTPQATMHMVALSPDHLFAHATSIKDGDVATFALGGDETKAVSVVPTGEGAEGLAVNPRTGEVWVGNRAANTVTVVDGRTGKAGEPFATADFPFRIVFTPDGAHALVSCAEGGEVQVFDSATKQLAKAISIGADGSELSAMPMGLCTDPEGARCYVACGRGEFVAVLDLAAGTVIARMKARAGPDGIAFVRVPLEPAAETVRR